MLTASLQKNDKKAAWLIGIFSVVVFVAVSVLAKAPQVNVDLGFDINLLALANSVINSLVAILLIVALVAVKQKKYTLHKQLMMAALALSVLFLVLYIGHKLFAGEARFGDANFDGVVDDAEKAAVGSIRIVYLLILITHITLAGLILPLILFTAYRAMTAEFPKHKKLARITWPLWFYVAVTGPVVYVMISPYYH